MLWIWMKMPISYSVYEIKCIIRLHLRNKRSSYMCIYGWLHYFRLFVFFTWSTTDPHTEKTHKISESFRCYDIFNLCKLSAKYTIEEERERERSKSEKSFQKISFSVGRSLVRNFRILVKWVMAFYYTRCIKQTKVSFFRYLSINLLNNWVGMTSAKHYSALKLNRDYFWINALCIRICVAKNKLAGAK